MRILVLQHVRCEHPGIFRTFLEEDGHDWSPIHLDEGEPLPSLEGFDALWVMGGPMDTWQEDQYPWLRAEKNFIRDAVVERGMPFLGLCLGHQLLAEALGGRCEPSKSPEIGVLDVTLTEDGAAGVLFDGLPEQFPCLQWHSAEVTRLPPGAMCLATSERCAVQAMSWQTRAYSMQFHVEVEDDTVANWSELPAYANALRSALGSDGVQQMTVACDHHMTQFNAYAERIYINWLQSTAHT